MKRAKPLVLDNTILWDAADALDREAAALERHLIEDIEAPAILRDAAEQLRAVAHAANESGRWCTRGTARIPRPVLAAEIQGVTEDPRGAASRRASVTCWARKRIRRSR